jgi:hypothetical protein
MAAGGEAAATAPAQAGTDYPELPTCREAIVWPCRSSNDSFDLAACVMGTHGRGAFAGVLLGSVSQQCVTHAHCPTVVVPQAKTSG